MIERTEDGSWKVRFAACLSREDDSTRSSHPWFYTLDDPWRPESLQPFGIVNTWFTNEHQVHLMSVEPNVNMMRENRCGRRLYPELFYEAFEHMEHNVMLRDLADPDLRLYLIARIAILAHTQESPTYTEALRLGRGISFNTSIHPHRPLWSDGFAEANDRLLSLLIDTREKRLRQDHQVQLDEGKYVYLVEGGPYHKIGVSKNPETRLRRLTIGPFPLKLVAIRFSSEPFRAESLLHHRFRDYQTSGEWFEFDAEAKQQVLDWFACGALP